MKSGYKRLFVFEIVVIVLLLLNSFVLSILSGYIKVGFIVLLLILFKFMFGFEKDRHRYWKSICLEVIIYLLTYFLIYYLSGLLFSFYKPIDFFTPSGVISVFIPLIMSIVLKEILRYMMLSKAEGSKLLVVLTCIIFIFIDVAMLWNLKTFSRAYDAFMFIALYLLPFASKNVVCTYMSMKSGYKPAILYLLVMELYVYILPIVPNPNEYIYAIYQLIMPFILLYRVYMFFKIDRDEDILREYNQKRVVAIIPSSIIIIFLVYITSGYFTYHAIAIGSGSMSPKINKGDVVVIEKNIESYEDLKIGQVIAYKYENRIIVHRLVKKIKVDGELYFYTKGDANNDIDGYKITKDMIIGKVNIRVPYIGTPTVWLNNL